MGGRGVKEFEEVECSAMGGMFLRSSILVSAEVSMHRRLAQDVVMRT